MNFNLDIELIKTAIKNPANKDRINQAIMNYAEHKTHIAGDDILIDAKIQKIEGIETDDAKSLRKSMQKAYTVPIMANLLKPFDKAFSARGGSREYKIENKVTEDLFEDLLNDVAFGKSLKTYMSEVWKQLVNIDPFGLLLLDTYRSDVGAVKAMITYKSVNDIFSIEYSSFLKIEFVIFNPIKTEINKKPVSIYRIVDDLYDMYVIEDGTNYEIAPIRTENGLIEMGANSLLYADNNLFSFQNQFSINGKFEVPAVFISQKSNRQDIKLTDTFVSESLCFADDFLFHYVILKTYIIRNGIPITWEYKSDCPECNGTGIAKGGGNCPICQGSGAKKNRSVADVRIIPIPNGMDGQTSLIPPAGYVQPDLATWQQFEVTLEKLKNSIHEAVWGGDSTVEKSKQSNSTAYEVSVKQEPVKSKLEIVSSAAEQIEKRLTDFFGFFYFPNEYKGCEIQYGRRYDIREANEIWQEYLSAKTQYADIESLNELLLDYYYVKYKQSPEELKKAELKLFSKPLFHYTSTDLIAMQPYLTDEDYFGNIYFSQFWSWLDTKEYVEKLTVEQVKMKLNDWLKTNNKIKDVSILSQNNTSGTTGTVR